MKINIFALSFFAAILFSTFSSAQNYSDGLPRSTPEAQGVSSEAIAMAFQKIQEKGYDVHGLMILRNGYVIAEHWWAPFAAEYQHAMYSATKTFTGCAVGFAVQEGYLKVSDKVVSFFPDLLPATMPKYLEELTVEHLLTMSCGHASTRYAGSGAEQVRSFLSADFSSRPGTVFAYDVACSHMLSHILTRVTGMSTFDYLKPRLFDKLGIEAPIWEMDNDGVNMGNGGMHLRTSDLAKLGQFLLNGGSWDGEQLLDKAWVEAQTTPHIYQRPGASEEEINKDDGGQGYGYQTWMGRHNSYRAIGGCNQLSMVVPEYNLVVACTSNVRDEAGFNQVFYEMLDGISDKKLKPNRTFNLAAAIEGYVYPVPYESAGEEYMLKNCTKIFNMYQNDLGLTKVSLRFDGDGNCTVTLETATAVHNHPYGLGKWRMGSTDRRLPQTFSYPNTMSVTPVRTAGRCAWLEPSVLSVTLMSMFNVGSVETMVFDMKDGLTMTVKGRNDVVIKGSR